MKIELEVKKVTVVTGSGTDKIMLHTTLPEGYYPYCAAAQIVYMDTARGKGEDYVRDHFGIDPEVINRV